MALAETKRIIDEADPEGLLEMGAPEDEYESAVAEITRRLLHGEDLPALLSRWYGNEVPGHLTGALVDLQRRLLE